MLSDDEKKAIELLKDIENNCWTTKYIMSSDSKNANTLLNLITKLQKENEILKRAFDKQTADMSNNLLELQQKDKQIDLMAKQIDILMNTNNEELDCFIPTDFSSINDCVKKKSCEDCIKKYFEVEAKKGE